MFVKHIPSGYVSAMLVASLNTGNIYTSIDHGTTWSLLLTSTINWGMYYSAGSSICVDTTGTKFAFATNQTQFVSASTTYGVYFYSNSTLTQADPSGYYIKSGSGVCSDISGTIYTYLGKNTATGVSVIRNYQ